MMTKVTPKWLPPKTTVNGTFREILSRLYKVFQSDFVDGKPKYKKCRICWDQRKIESLYDECFWHLITKEIDDERLLDPERAKRLPWCAPVIMHVDEDVVLCWNENRPKNKIYTHLWLKEWDYIVVLSRGRNNQYYLVTAYYVEGRSTYRRLSRRYNNNEKC